ncbi:MAG: thiol-disulfide oxidoreductase DCC family protein [Burkholderiaceae bacterium]
MSPRNSAGNTRYGQLKKRLARAAKAAENSAVYPLTLYYESACPLCNAEMTNLMLRNHGQLLRFVDVSAPGFAAVPPGTSLQDLLDLIHAQRADGQVVKGVEVFRLAYEAVGLGGVARALRLPVLGALAKHAYPLLARNRHRIPRSLVRFMFEGAVRRAAQRAAQTHCTPEICTPANPG